MHEPRLVLVSPLIGSRSGARTLNQSPSEVTINQSNYYRHSIENRSKLNFIKTGSHLKNLYLLLTEFEVRTVSYGPSFFPLIYGPSAKRAGHKSTGKNEDP